MTGEDEGEASPGVACLIEEGLVEGSGLADDTSVRAVGRDSGKTGGCGVRNGKDVTKEVAIRRVYGDQVAIRERVFVSATDVADNVDLDGLENVTRGFEAGCGIVIAGGDDDGHRGAGLMEAAEDLVVKSEGFREGIGGIEDVTGDKECVGLVLLGQLDYLTESGAVFGVA